MSSLGAVASDQDLAPLPTSGGKKRTQLFWIFFSLFFSVLAAFISPSFVVIYEDWNAFSWGLVILLLSGIMFSERTYRFHCEKYGKQPNDHIRPILFLSVLTLSGSITGMIMYLLLSVRHDRTFFPDGFAMSLFCSFLVFCWSLALFLYSKRLHMFRKLNLFAYGIMLLLSAIGVIAGIGLFVVYIYPFKSIPASLFGALTAFQAFLAGFEFRYRHYCLQNNRPTHEHLRILFGVGLVCWVFGKVAGTLLIGIGLKEHQNFTYDSSFMGALSAALTEFWGFTLMYTVWHFRFTEVSVDLFFKTSINESSRLVGSDISDDDD